MKKSKPKFEKKDWNAILNESTSTRNFEMMKRAVTKKRADMNYISEDGNTPLANAIRRGHIDIIRYLLKSKDPDITRTGTNGKNCLHWAIIRNHMEVVKLILAKVNNVTINLSDGNGNPPLIYAVQEKRTVLAELLIKKGAEVDACGANGRNPLEEAILLDDFPTVKLLVERRANINRLDLDGNTPLGLAVKCKNRDIVELLVLKGADVSKCGDRGKSPLSWAVVNEDFGLVESLVENGMKGCSVQKAFLDAVMVNSLDMVKFFVEKGLVDLRSRKVWTRVKEVGDDAIVGFLEGLQDGSDSDDDSFVKVEVDDVDVVVRCCS